MADLNAKLDTRVLTSVRRNPGSRCVEIADRIGESTHDVTLSLLRLKRSGRVKRKGQTKATTYRVS